MLWFEFSLLAWLSYMLLHGVWFSILDALSGGARLSTYYVIRLILSQSYRQERLDKNKHTSVRLRGRCFAGADQWQSWRCCSAASLRDFYRAHSALAGVGHALDAAGDDVALSTVGWKL